MVASPPSILTFEEARRVVEQHAALLNPHGSESLNLLDAAGRVLAEPIYADRDFPPFPRATRDGYAVRAANVASVPATLPIVGEIKAGARSDNLRLTTGQAIAIMTGAAVPDGADAVVMVEHTDRAADRVTVHRGVSVGENIVPVGAEARKGNELLPAGTRLDYAGVALAASVGRSSVVVHVKPSVAVVSTGDEVVDINVDPGPTQIRNSNSYSLAAQIREASGDPVIFPVAPDERGRLRRLIQEGIECDLLLIAGGVSMGKYDLVEQVLAELKAEFFFTGVQIQPGKPVVFGRIPCGADTRVRHEDRSDDASHKYFFGLPGNPISTMVTFELFARPIIEALTGMASRKLIYTHAKLKSEIKTKTGLKRFLPANLSGEFEQAQVELTPWQGSGDIAAVARSNCFVVVPPDRGRIEAGEWVAVLLR
jgi:molybdopterin molybdotransferase